MKIIYKIFVVLFLTTFVVSCNDEGDIFTGSPVGTNVQFETIEATVATAETNVVGGQSFPVTVTIPQVFPVDVSIEVITFLPNTNKRARKYFTILAGQTSKTDMMNTPNPDQGVTLPFNQTVQLYLTAIANASTGENAVKGFQGKQYSLTSNVVELDYGDTSIVTANSNRFGLRLDWAGPYSGTGNNSINLRLKKEGVLTTVAGASSTSSPIHGTITANTGRYKTINFLSSAPDGTYTVEYFAVRLTNTPSDLPYRFTFRFPDESTKVIAGVFNGLTIGTAATAVPILQIVKSTDADGAHYVVTQL